MKPFYQVAVTAAAIIGAAALAAAQPPAALLNKVEVQRLVAMETPEANLTLAAHFTALAERYEADAANHTAMGRAYRANANRSAVTNAGAHCERLATLATQSAGTARELSAYHRGLAGGGSVVVPKDAARFHAGHGAPDPTKDQLHHLAIAARTRADHLTLEEYFATVANARAVEAEEHRTIARAYRAGVRKGTYDPAVNCDRLAQLAREAAKAAKEAAAFHRQLATIG